MSNRQLTPQEISDVESRGCCCSDWSRVTVDPSFSPLWFKEVTFSGDVAVGKLGQELVVRVVPQVASLSFALIHNCSIGDGVYIKGVRNHIANYDIADHVWIENINTLEVSGETTFGNGVVVKVLHEQGGRAVTIYNSLSAQVAYMQAFYRNRTKLVEALENLAQVEVAAVKSSRGTVGTHSSIFNSGIISNVHISEYSDIHNTQRLKNGTLQGTKEFPVSIGTGVIADDFIIGANSELKDQAIISSCFVGEGCSLSRGFSAEHSLFFANSVGSHGEVFSIFAGPHTVTHHKATLLIGAYMSFLNAGSGSNQSNNLYKLGPLHQGVIERGSKTASDSYVLWPARVGTFTLITGRHTNHCDTSKLPYSYLIEQNNDSFCIPGVNFKSVGTIRDADKWPRRDRRSSGSVDLINYDLLSPYTVGKMEEGLEVLKGLVANQVRSNQEYYYKGVVIPSSAADKGIDYYGIGIIKFLGNVLIRRILASNAPTWVELHQSLMETSDVGNEEWVDMSGLLAPQSVIKQSVRAIEAGTYTQVSEIHNEMQHIFTHYSEWVWNWCAPRIAQAIDCSWEEMTPEALVLFLQKWIEVTETLDNYFEDDAQKEFNQRSRIGFGVDGDSVAQDDDFTAVRGTPEDNPFVESVMSHLSNKQELFNRAKDFLAQLS